MPYGAPDVWDLTVDVVIVGSGFAGLSAAVEASSKGLKVIVLEKMHHYGGNSRISGGGYCSWDSKLKLREKNSLGEDSPQLHLADTLKGGSFYNVPTLVDRMVREAPDGLNWLIDAGIEFESTLHHIGAHSTARSYQEKNRSGAAIVEALYKLAVKNGVVISLDSKVDRFWREDANGPVTGLRYLDENTQKNIQSLKGIVLASGGYARDTELVLQNNPRLGCGYLCSNHSGATGEIVRYAREIGADSLHMEFIQLFPCADAGSGLIDRTALDCYSGAGLGAVYVNKEGLRFVNELAGRDEVSDAQLLHQSKPTWAILNKDIFDHLDTPIELLDRRVESKRLEVGNTIEELSAKTGINEAALVTTINEHNAVLKNMLRDKFNKPLSAQMRTIAKGPYYAAAQWPSVHFCMGGLRINKDAHVLDIWGNRIPKLFAAGEVCGGVHGANRLGGNAIPECIVFGRIAGRGVIE